MPGVFHELLVFLIRAMPGCAEALLAMAAAPELRSDWLTRPFHGLSVVDSNLSVDAGRELRADLVLVEELEPSEPPTNSSRATPNRRGLVFEIQLDGPKDTKERAWLAYCAEFWLREHVEPALVVVADDDAVVRRATRPLAPAGPTLCVRPLVVHCRDILAVFLDESGKPTSALTEANLRDDPSVRGLFLLAAAYAVRSNRGMVRHLRPFVRDVLQCVDEHTTTRYTDAVSLISPDANKLLESVMRPYKEEPYEYKSEYFRPAYLKGKEEGEAIGIAEGVLVGQRSALKRLLARRYLLTTAAERLIDAAETSQLERWFDEMGEGIAPTELVEH